MFEIAFWSFLYAVGFIYLASEWSKTPSSPEATASGNNLRAAITFSLFSAFSWVCYIHSIIIILTFNHCLNCLKAGSSFFAYQRYRQGADSAFATAYETGLAGQGGVTSPGSGMFTF